MPLPLRVLPFKEPRTEIKLINGAYYKYQISYLYDPVKKRPVKKTGPVLGKITENGFVPSPKHQLRSTLRNPRADIKTYGVYALFALLLSDEIPSLKRTFGTPPADILLSFAMTGRAYQSPIKRAPFYHAHHFSSEVWGVDTTLTDKILSGALNTAGENRELVVKWLKGLLPPSAARESFILLDSTHVMSASEHLEINAKGYNGSFDFGKQLRLMYLFSARMKLPVYYRLLGGNIVDVAATALCVKEMGVSEVVYIADKGFYSRENVAGMEEGNLWYIMPVRRNNPSITYGPPGDGAFKLKNRRFIRQGRVIRYYQYEVSGHSFITYLDDRLRVEEEQDYLNRIITHPDGYTEAGYEERLRHFGTLTLTYHMNGLHTAEEVYTAYKQRNEIEMMFDSYKSFMKGDVTYMRNRYVLEGRLFTNFIAMMAYYKLYTRLRETKLLGKYSPKDIIEMSKTVYQMGIGGTWHLAEVTAKLRKLLAKAGLDYLNKQS
jgi:hypothetical protein